MHAPSLVHLLRCEKGAAHVHPRFESFRPTARCALCARKEYVTSNLHLQVPAIERRSSASAMWRGESARACGESAVIAYTDCDPRTCKVRPPRPVCHRCSDEPNPGIHCKRLRPRRSPAPPPRAGLPSTSEVRRPVPCHAAGPRPPARAGATSLWTRRAPLPHGPVAVGPRVPTPGPASDSFGGAFGTIRALLYCKHNRVLNFARRPGGSHSVVVGTGAGFGNAAPSPIGHACMQSQKRSLLRAPRDTCASARSATHSPRCVPSEQR